MNTSRNTQIFTLGILFLPLFFLAPILFPNSNTPVLHSIRTALGPIYGISMSDLAQDIVGFRAMSKRENAYPILSTADQKYGIGFPTEASSTHPPTAFLFVAPIAPLPWKYASIAWAAMMIIGTVGTFKLMEFAWPRAIGCGFLSLLWLPIMESLGQFTVLWLVLVTAAYALRNKHAFASGFCIGIAALMKLLPAVMIIPFVLHRKWAAVSGFISALVMGLTSVLLISPKAFSQFINTKQNAQMIIARSDNASLFNVSRLHLGFSGFAIALLLLAVFLALNLKYISYGDRDLTDKSWMIWSYLSVVFLPVVWVYSLVPLLPIVVALTQSRVRSVELLGWAIFILPIWGRAWGDRSVIWIVGMTVLIGIGMTLNNFSHAYRSSSLSRMKI